MNVDNKIKAMLVDDHPVVLNGLKNLIHDIGTVEIIAEASNGKNALDILEKYSIDIVITDINMPEMDGIELTRNVKKRYPHTKVLILTAYNEREILKRAFSSGAEACILKNTSKKELLEAINKIIDNGYYYCDEILSIARGIHKCFESNIEQPVILSPRELEVLELILHGFSNKEIANKLNISFHTVSSHRKNTMKKTGSHNVSGLFSYVQKFNLFPALFEEN